MEYKLDSLNIKNGDYIFVSKNGRKYDIGEVLSKSYDLDNKRTYDIVTIYDFDAPIPEFPYCTKVELVNWFFGCNFESNETEKIIRKYVDEYEKKLFTKEKKEMIIYKTIVEGIFGDCRGVIYIEMIKRATNVCMDAEKIKDFADDLWKKLYEEFDEIFVGLGETDYSFNPNTTDDNITHWYRIYEEDGSQYADKIEIVKEKGEILGLGICVNEAFDIMVKEIQDNMCDCSFEIDAFNQMYDGLERAHLTGKRYFYIIDEEHSVLNPSETPEKYYIKYVFEDDGDYTITKYDIRKEK